MASEKVDIPSTDLQMAVLGCNDHIARMLESDFNVIIGLRGTVADITGDDHGNVLRAKSVISSLVRLYRDGETDFSDSIVRQLIDESIEGDPDAAVDAMGDVVAYTHRAVPVKCRTAGQKRYITSLRDNIVTICIGPAGTGKTYLAAAQAVDELRRGRIDRIIMSRPAIESGGEKLGFLPGDLEQKVDPYLRPLYDALYDMYGEEKAARLRERGTIEIAPLAYMRGRTLNRARVIIDESQNLSLSTLKMALTRIGEGSRMVLTGDVTQIDLPDRRDSGLETCAEILRDIDGVGIVHLTNLDVVRNRIVRNIIKAFEKAEDEANIQKRHKYKGHGR